MNFNGWLFIDKADLGPGPVSKLPAARFKGAREAFSDWEKVRYLSVSFSPVGATIINRCPNLRWIMIRRHATEGLVDLALCRQRGIGLALAAPTGRYCANYIRKHLGPAPYLFYGAGRIAQLAAAGIDNPRFINSKTDENTKLRYLGRAGTVISTLPFDSKGFGPPILRSHVFNACNGAKFISIAQAGTIANRDLLNAIFKGHISSAVVDKLNEECRGDLIATGRVNWTQHIAWKEGFDQNEYLDGIASAASLVAANMPANPVIYPK